jgi:hypothetical protein
MILAVGHVEVAARIEGHSPWIRKSSRVGSSPTDDLYQLIPRIHDADPTVAELADELGSVWFHADIVRIAEGSGR